MANALSQIPEGQRIPHIYPTEFWTQEEETVVKVPKKISVRVVTKDDDGNDVERMDEKEVMRDEVQYIQEDYVRWVKKGDHKTANVVKVRLMKRLDPEGWRVIAPYYDKWKKGEEMPETGTPLANWPLIKGKRQVDQLRLLSILTVEDLAMVSDSMLENIGMGGRTLRDQAKRYVEMKTGDAASAVIIDKQGKTIDMLQSQLEEMQKDMARLTAALPQREKPGDIAKKKGG